MYFTIDGYDIAWSEALEFCGFIHLDTDLLGAEVAKASK